jgi:hypothetical protein
MTDESKELEVLGVAGHSAGVVVNTLGVFYNARRGSRLYLGFHAVALLFHGYAIYSHWRELQRGKTP